MSKKLKTCIIGNMGVGKTSIILRIYQGIFKQGTIPTTGVDYKSKKHKIKGQDFTIQLWDTTGQDRFRSVVSNFFRDSHGIFLVFDMNDIKSINDIDFWLKQLDKYLDNSVPKILMANKCDLKAELSPQYQKKVNEYIQTYNLRFYKVSAKKGTNINQAYETLLQDCYEYFKKLKQKQKKQSIFISQNEKQVNKKKKGCC